MMAVQYDRQSTVKLLLSHKADVDLRCTRWPTPPVDASALDIAARHNRHEMVTTLLEHGAVVDSTSMGGVTALMCAAKNESVESVRILLAHRADPRLRMEDGVNAIELAMESIGEGELNPTLAPLLEASGARRELVMAAKHGVVSKNANGEWALFPSQEAAAGSAGDTGEQTRAEEEEEGDPCIEKVKIDPLPSPASST